MTTSAEQSLWIDTAPTARHRPLEGDLDVDVAVLGGGIAGLTTALLLKQDGARVAVIEAERVGQGVTGTNTAKGSALQQPVYTQTRARHGTEGLQAYGAASLAGVGEVERLARELKIDCGLERAPAFTYAASESEMSSVEREAEACREGGLRVELVDDVDLPYEVPGAVRLDEQIRFQPTRYAQGLAKAIGTVYERTRALSVREGSPCEVRTTRGTVRAQQVVVATHY